MSKRLRVHRMILAAPSFGMVVLSISREDSVVSLWRADVTSTISKRRLTGAAVRCQKMILDRTFGALSRGHHLRDGRVVGGGLIRAQVH